MPAMKSFRRQAWLPAACVLVAATAIYYTGLSTGFQLDDWSNLANLGLVDEEGLLYYVFGGAAGPTARPLSLLSFALQYSSWPDQPFAFKAVNLAIHLACGALIFELLRRLARLGQAGPGGPAAFALAVMTLWLLHPIQSTTVLYVVQRMTQLSALFTLLGLVLYLYCRERYLARREPFLLPLTGVAVWACTALAVLSKENGILLPLLALVIDATLLAGSPGNPAWSRWNRAILWTPLAALVMYLAWVFDATLAGYASRPFTMAERLLTQPLVLLDYAQKILFPVPGAFSTYHDDFPVARGLLSEPRTLAAAVLVILAAAGAVLLRRRAPLFCFGILWFLAGHLLESSYLNLELYFEHRNYLPSLGLFVAVVHGAFLAGRRFSRPAVAAALLAVYTAGVAAVTLSEVRLWTDPLQRNLQLLRRHPDSPRTIESFGNYLIATGRTDDAERFYRRLAEERPADIYPHLKLMAIAGCVRARSIGDDEWEALIRKARGPGPSALAVVEELVAIVSTVGDDNCRTLDGDRLTRVVVALALNPAFVHDRAQLHELAAWLGVLIGDAGVAYHNIVEAVRLSPTVPRQIVKLRILLALGRFEETEESLRVLKMRLESSLRMRAAYSRTVSRIEADLTARLREGALRGSGETGDN